MEHSLNDVARRVRVGWKYLPGTGKRSADGEKSEISLSNGSLRGTFSKHMILVVDKRSGHSCADTDFSGAWGATAYLALAMQSALT